MYVSFHYAIKCLLIIMCLFKINCLSPLAITKANLNRDLSLIKIGRTSFCFPFLFKLSITITTSPSS